MREVVTCVVMSILLSIPTAAAADLAVEAQPGALSITGATSGGDVVVAGVDRRLEGYVTVVRSRGDRVTASLDGVATYAAPWLDADADSGASAWAVVDVETGSVAVLETGVREREFTRTAHGLGEDLVVAGQRLRVLVVRAGVDVWDVAVADGGDRDGDRQRDGSIAVLPGAFETLGAQPTPFTALAVEDIVIAIDFDDLSVSVVDLVESSDATDAGDAPKTIHSTPLH